LLKNDFEARDRLMRPSNSLDFSTPMLTREVGSATFSATLYVPDQIVNDKDEDPAGRST